MKSLISFGSAAAAVAVIWSTGISRDVQARLAQLRAAGEPVTAEDLADVYRLPPNTPDDTRFWLTAIEPLDTQAFIAACGQLPLVGTGEGEIPPPDEPWPRLDDSRALLAQYAGSLRGLHLAADGMGGVRYPMNFGDGIAMLLPHAQRLRSAARLLALEAHVKAHEGDAAGAADALYAGLAVARTIEHDPVLVMLLVRIAIDGIFREVLERLFSEVEFSDADLARLRADLRQTTYQAGLLRAMRGERVTGLATIQNPSQALGDGSPSFRGLTLFHGTDTRCYLECMELSVAQAKLPPSRAFAGMKQLDADLRATMGDGSPLSRVRTPLTNLLVPALTAVFTASARGTASIDTADAALAVEQFRRRHGKLPQRLDELVPEFLPAVPIDAFDGQPLRSVSGGGLRYLVRADSYVVYSVGHEMIDQEGLRAPTLYEPGDLTFEVKRGVQSARVQADVPTAKKVIKDLGGSVEVERVQLD